MARTERDIVSYFPHDAGANNSDTLTILQNRFGNNGYAVWFKLLEKLSASEGHYIDCRNHMRWQLLIAYFGVDEITTIEILKLLVEIEAIDKELWGSRVIWCQNLVNNVADVYKNRRREIPQKPLITNNNPNTTQDNTLTTPNNTQSKVKYIKVNNIYTIWNEQKILIHKKLTPEISRAIDTALKDNTEEEVIQAIKNYSEIINHSDLYYFSYRWTLKDFLHRGLAKFADIEVAKKNYQKDKEGTTFGRPTTGHNPRELPRVYTPTPDYGDAIDKLP